MIHFFRDILDGPVYVVVVIICIIGILAILRYLLEHSKKTEEYKSSVKDVNVSATNSHSGTLFISSEELEESAKEQEITPEVQITSSGNSQEGTTSNEAINILELNSSEILEQPISENLSSPKDELVLDISSSDSVKVEEIESMPEEKKENKMTDMTTVIDFGSTDDIEIPSSEE